MGSYICVDTACRIQSAEFGPQFAGSKVQQFDSAVVGPARSTASVSDLRRLSAGLKVQRHDGAVVGQPRGAGHVSP